MSCVPGGDGCLENLCERAGANATTCSTGLPCRTDANPSFARTGSADPASPEHACARRSVRIWVELESGCVACATPGDGWRDGRHADPRCSPGRLGSYRGTSGLGERGDWSGSAGKASERMEDCTMSRVREELAVIPAVMWALTIVGYV